MNTYLLSLGWWNLSGSILMLGFFNEDFGRKILNEWTKIFKTEYKLDHWSRLWLFWAVGLNIFFGLINIFSVRWGHEELKRFLVYSDVVAYILLVFLALWATLNKKMGSGVYSVFFTFAGWIVWGIMSLL